MMCVYEIRAGCVDLVVRTQTTQMRMIGKESPRRDKKESSLSLKWSDCLWGKKRRKRKVGCSSYVETM
jgi:hypothetical protein